MILKNWLLKKIFTNSLWSLLGSIIGRGGTLAAGLIAARLLEVQGFGQLGIVRSTIGTFAIFGGMGLSATATIFIAKFRTKDLRYAGELIGFCNIVAVLLSVVTAILIFVFSTFIAKSVMNEPNLSSSVKIGALLILFSCLAKPGEGSLAGFEEFKSLAKLSFAEGLTVLLSMFPLTYYYGVNGAVFSLVSGQFIKLLIVKIMVKECCKKRNIVISKNNIRSKLPILWNYSIPAFLCGFMYGPAIWIINIMIVRQVNGFEILGLVSAGEQWKTLIIFIPGVLGTVFLPILANQKEENENKQYKNTVLLSIGVQFIIALLFAIPIISVSSFIPLLYGESFQGMSIVIIILSVTSIFNVLGNASGTVLMTFNNIWFNFLLNLIWALILIISTYALIDKYREVGVSFAYLIAFSLHSFLMLYFALKKNNTFLKKMGECNESA